MLSNKKFKELDKNLDESFNNVAESFGAVHSRIDRWGKVHLKLADAFNELREELATNGVIRDLRKIEKAHAEFERQTVAFMDSVDARFAELEHNGVATAINKLNTEVFGTQKETAKGGYMISQLMAHISGVEYTPEQEVTLAGKVEAIVEHLGLNVTVKPREVIESKVEVSKKPIAKKKGKK